MGGVWHRPRRITDGSGDFRISLGNGKTGGTQNYGSDGNDQDALDGGTHGSLPGLWGAARGSIQVPRAQAQTSLSSLNSAVPTMLLRPWPSIFQPTMTQRSPAR